MIFATNIIFLLKSIRLKVRDITHRVIIIHRHIERIIIALHIYRITIVHIIASILIRATAPLVRNRQLNHIVLIRHRVKIPFVTVREQRATHKRQYILSVSIRPSEYSHLTIRGINRLCRGVYGDASRVGTIARMHVRAVVLQWSLIRIHQHVTVPIRGKLNRTVRDPLFLNDRAFS